MTKHQDRLRVVYYARVSTKEDGQINSLDNQIAHFENLIKSNKNWIFSGGYVDEGISGTSAYKRKNFIKMIDDAKSGKFDLIVTKEISRFSRNTLDSIMYTRELLKYGVAVFFESDNINTLSSDSELRLTIMSAVAQDEVRRISERIKFGFKQCVSDGKVLGTNLTGYTKKDGELKVDEKSAEIIRKIFNMYAYENIGIREISKRLESEGILNKNFKPYTFSTIKNIIENPKYKGYYCGHKYENLDIRYGKKTKILPENRVLKKDEKIPAIVSEDVWERANKLLGERSKKFSANETVKRYPMSGKIFCGFDNAVYHRSVFGKKEVWICSDYKKYGKEKCGNFVIYTDELAGVLNGIFKDKLDFFCISKELVRIYGKTNIKTKSNTEFTKQKLEKYKLKKKRLIDALTENLISKEEFMSEKADIDKIISGIEKSMMKTKSGNLKIKQDDILSFISAHKSDILSSLIEKICVFKKENTVFLSVNLADKNVYEVSYRKKGSRVLSDIKIKKQTKKSA